MDGKTATNIVKDTFEQPFDKGRFVYFTKNLLNFFDESRNFVYQGNYVPDAYKPYISTLERLGKYKDANGNRIDILVAQLKKETSLERARTMQRNFIAWYLNGSRGGELKDAALVAFVSPDSRDWRFSIVRMDYRLEESQGGKVKVRTELTPARRLSFLVGENESSHTAQKQLFPILADDKNNPSLADLERAFGIEVVTKEFFGKYRDLFLDVKDALDDIVKKDAKIREDFSAKGANTLDFSKKLLGQIVFLYFLQKKGWFGIARDAAWGSGPKNFLRLLFDKKVVSYQNFFNDILEPLFYEALAKERDNDFYSRFNCKIPFLNGGLFDPINNYDWVHTDILIPNKLFSNNEKTKEGDTGTGVLDIFDRYNFTVWEDEPLEKEVAVDPEMLGKVFENLLDVKDRKSMGTYYTPREIVHYMCQESLINYLDNAVNTSEAPLARTGPPQGKLFGKPDPEQLALRTTAYKPALPKEDIEHFVRRGEFTIEHDAAKESGTKSYMHKLPTLIRNNARLIDEKLDQIRVCDPAVGSGAFLVGMMHIIVKCRNVLTTYLDGKARRSIYDFKRHAIQTSLYGVDIDPGAVEIAKLRLWLSLVVDEEDIRQIKPLPNLDYKIVCGNSLMGYPYEPSGLEQIEKLKEQFFDEVRPKEKNQLRLEIDNAIHNLFNNTKKSLGYKVTVDFKVNFSEVLRERGGFDVVMANPPYNELRDLSSEEQKDYRKSEYYDYALGGRVNLFQFFYPLAIAISRRPGIISLITQNSILAEDSALANRRHIVENCRIVRFVSFPERDDVKKRVFENAKMSVCIGILNTTKPVPADYDFEIDVWYDRYFSKGHSLRLSLSEIKNIYPTKLIFPISSEVSFKILKKIREKEDVFYVEAKSGEIDMTKFKSRFNTSRIGYRVLTGAQVLRYRITNVPSQGEVIYLDIGLSEFPVDKRKHIENARIVMQRITGVDSRVRLIMTMIPGNALCANSTNYIPAGQGQELKYILGVLNSTLINYYFKQTSTNTNITTSEINNIPIPKATESMQNNLASLVQRILTITKDKDPVFGSEKQEKVQKLERDIDHLVYLLFDLSKEETTIIQNDLGKP